MRTWAGLGRGQLHDAQGLAKAESLWERPQSANLEGMAIVQLYEGMMESTQVALDPGLNYLV